MMGEQAKAYPAAGRDAPSAALQPLLTQLLKLAAMISRPMDDAVAAPNGLSLTELKVLMCLLGEGAHAGHEITALMAIPPMNVSRALAALTARGWIEPASDPANRRRRPVRLSARGREICAAMDDDVNVVAHDLLGALGAAEVEALEGAVAAILGRIERWPAAGRDPR